MTKEIKPLELRLLALIKNDVVYSMKSNFRQILNPLLNSPQRDSEVSIRAHKRPSVISDEVEEQSIIAVFIHILTFIQLAIGHFNIPAALST